MDAERNGGSVNRPWPVILALALLPALTMGCGDSEDRIVNGPAPVEAFVFGMVETNKGAPVEGVAISIEAWREGCGNGAPIRPSGSETSQLTTDSVGLYFALLQEEADSFDACLTIRAEPAAVLHLLPASDTGATVSFRAPEARRDTAAVDFVLPPDRPVLYSAIAAEGSRTCALSTRGAAFCWGGVGLGNVSGIVFFDTTTTPLAVRGALEFTAIDASPGHGCGITPAGAAFCWGSNFDGELGDGTGNGDLSRGSRTPVEVLGGHAFSVITTGDAGVSCGVTIDGTGFCWGNNFVGQLGTGSEDFLSPVPVPVAGDLQFVDIEAGLGFTCGVADAGAAYCWGNNEFGELGNGMTGTRSRVPVPVAGGLVFAAVDVASIHACGITTDGPTYCWGRNASGQLGDDTTTDSSTPVEVQTGVRFVRIATGTFHTCGLTEMGQAFCWGLNDRGQLGDGTQTDRLTPVPVATSLVFISLAAGERHTCGVDAGGTAYCWGRGEFGDLGTGVLMDQAMPVPVTEPR